MDNGFFNNYPQNETEPLHTAANESESAAQTQQSTQAQPGRTAQPTQPGRTAQPTQPGQTAQPTQPTQPGQPVGQSGYTQPTYRPVNSYTYPNPTQQPQQSVYRNWSQPQHPFTPQQSAQQFHQPQAPQNHNASDKAKKGGFSAATLVICIIVAAIVAASVSSVASLMIFSKNSSTSSKSGTTAGNSNITISDSSDNYVEAVAAKVQPSVVGIVCKYSSSYNSIFGNGEETSSSGSGVIYSSDGYIITNKHVVEYAISYNGSVDVYLPDDTNTAIPATIVGYDAAYDLAVLKIDRTGLDAITIGTSADLKVGQRVVAVGNPGGLQFIGSVSVGYLSGVNRELNIDSFTMSLLQTDAAINPGNSGGALVNSEGKLIGITNSKIVSEQFEGMGFAIPVDSVVDVCKNIITNKDEPKPYIGVQIATSYTSDYLKARGLPEGIVVASVVSGGPAEKAGIQQYDIITAADGESVTTYAKLVNIIQKHGVGDTFKLTVYRNGKTFDVSVTPVASNG